MRTINLNRRFAVAALALGLGAAPLFAGDLYNDIQTGDTNGGPETTSWGSTSNGDSSFGNVINLASGQANIATVVLSNYATASQYGADPGSSYNANLTFNLYAVTGSVSPDSDNSADLSSTPVESVTENVAINYRPEASGSSSLNCGAGNSPAYYDVATSSYSCGQLDFVNFGLDGSNLAAGNYIYTVSINSGASDPAAASLNWALNNFTDATSISAVSNPGWDTAYENGIATYGWGSIGQGELAISSAPEPATFGLIGLGLLGLGVSVRKKSNRG